MKTRNIDRRSLLRAGGAMSLLGAAGPFALQMAAAGEASAASASSYKALVCIYLYGGNDGHGTVLATDSDSWNRYWAARNTGSDPIALLPPNTAPTPVGQVSPVTGRIAQTNTPEFWGGVLPITPITPQPIPGGAVGSVRTFALHPFLGPLQSLFQQGRLAIVANVGTLVQPTTKAQFLSGLTPLPGNLFSHVDQQRTWQTGPGNSGSVGWGGSMADVFVGANGANSLLTAITPTGGAALPGVSIYLAGANTRKYVVNTGPQPANTVAASVANPLFRSQIGASIMTTVVQNTASTSNLANDYAAIAVRSMNAAATVNNAVSSGLASTVAAPPNYVSPFTQASAPNPVAQQLQTVAQLIAAGPGLGLTRQVFFVGLNGFDTHTSQNPTQPDLLGQVAQGMAYFDSALANVGGADLRGSVTTFTASEFGRTFTTNGTGTDHAWGSHHFVMGGAVRGGDIYGQYPTLGVDLGGFTNPDMVGDYLVPTTSADQYAATLGAWFGLPPTNLAAIFPNLANFGTQNLGFV